MSVTWFTADTHWGHGNIIKYCDRPFLSDVDRQVYEENENSWHNGTWKGRGASSHRISRESIQLMDDTLIDNINAHVKPNDTLWHLGDVLFAKKHEYVYRAYKYLSRINCKNIHIVWGNHDSPEVTDNRGRTIGSNFKSQNSLTEINVQGQKIVLCHYAMAVWDKSHRGAWQLYGHSHAGAEPWLNRVMAGRRSMDVGVDNAALLLGEYRPFSFDEIQTIMADRTGLAIDHHIEQNAPTEEQLINNSP